MGVEGGAQLFSCFIKKDINQMYHSYFSDFLMIVSSTVGASQVCVAASVVIF